MNKVATAPIFAPPTTKTPPTHAAQIGTTTDKSNFYYNSNSNRLSHFRLNEKSMISL